VEVTCRRLLIALLCAAVVPALPQVASISHFVAPSYPPLARQVGISGQARVALSVARNGSVANISEEASTHAFLAEEVKRSVERWSFSSATRDRKVTVIVYFGFSGEPRDINPKTTVTADFDDSLVRVFVTTNPAPSVRP
jgi:TonB family protein